MPSSKEIMTLSGVAAYIGVHIDTVRRWDRTGALKAQRNLYGFREYLASTVRRFKNKRDARAIGYR